MSKKLVIIPTYNEKENISNIIDAVLGLEGAYHVLVVDDGSPDGTANIVKTKKTTSPESIHLLERKGKLGLGTAYIAGFKYGLKNNYDYIFEMDADFSHNPNDLPRLLEKCQNGADAAVGSRYVDGGKLENWPADRVFLSKGASLYVRMITWMPIMDPTAGFMCYSNKALARLDLDKIKFVGYAFQIEMKFALYQLGLSVKEVPITFKDREEGVSKMSANIVNEAIFGVLKMKWNSFFKSYKNTTRQKVQA